MEEVVAMWETISKDQILRDIVTSVAIVIVSFLVAKIVGVLISAFRSKIIKRAPIELGNRMLELLARFGRRLIVIIGLYLAVHQLSRILSPSIFRVVDGALYIAVVFIIVLFIIDLTNTLMRWYSQRLEEKNQVFVSREFLPLFDKIVKIALIFIAAIFILKHFNQDVGSLIVSLGVGSLAIALAAQSTLANMIAGFTILIDRPFRVGDRIMLASGEIGDVYEIGMRSTKVLTFDNTLIIVPNAEIVKEKVTNLSYPDPKIRVVVEVGVAYGSDVELVKKLLREAAQSHPKVLDDPPPAAYLINFGDSSLDFRLICRIANFMEQWRVAEELRVKINEVFAKNNIEIPFPQRVVHMAKTE